MAALTSDALYAVLHDCLFSDAELPDFDHEDTEANRKMVAETTGAVVVTGIVASYGLHPQRLESHREQIHAMLEELPIQFRTAKEGGGGGWTFLNMCMKADGEQWTGFQQQQEALGCLAIALGLGRWVPRSRDLWVIFPGSVPYFEWGDDLDHNIAIVDDAMLTPEQEARGITNVPLPEEETSEHGA